MHALADIDFSRILTPSLPVEGLWLELARIWKPTILVGFGGHTAMPFEPVIELALFYMHFLRTPRKGRVFGGLNFQFRAPSRQTLAVAWVQLRARVLRTLRPSGFLIAMAFFGRSDEVPAILRKADSIYQGPTQAFQLRRVLAAGSAPAVCKCFLLPPFCPYCKC